MRFKDVCKDFGVLDSDVCLVATEATRTAINGPELLHRIEDTLAWKSKLLSMEEEGRLGAMGIASSVDDAEGLVLVGYFGGLASSFNSVTDRRIIVAKHDRSSDLTNAPNAWQDLENGLQRQD